MVPACGLCNNHKGDKSLKEFLDSEWLKQRRIYVTNRDPHRIWMDEKVLFQLEQEDYQRMFKEEQDKQNGNLGI